MPRTLLFLLVAIVGCGSDNLDPADAAVDAPGQTDPTHSADAVVDAPPAVDAGVDLAPDLAPPGSKGVGEHCTDGTECADEMICASGEHTSAHCTPRCDSTEQCNAAAPPAKGQCVPVGGFDGNICIWFCGFLAEGADCPGDLRCEVAACR